MNLDNFVSLAEKARLMKVSRQTLYNRIEAGTAPKYLRVGNRYLFEKTAEADQTHQQEG